MDVKLKATNEQTRKKNPHRLGQQYGGYQKEEGEGGTVKGKGGQIYGDEDDLASGGEHVTPCTGDVSWKFTLGTCIILLTTVTPIHVI